MNITISPLFLESTHPGFRTGSSFPSVLECTGPLPSGPLLLGTHYCPSSFSVASPPAIKIVFLLSFWRAVLVCARMTWGTLPRMEFAQHFPLVGFYLLATLGMFSHYFFGFTVSQVLSPPSETWTTQTIDSHVPDAAQGFWRLFSLFFRVSNLYFSGFAYSQSPPSFCCR